MDWLSANWIWILLIGFMLWMHLGMHRGHGSHGGHGGCGGGHVHRESEPEAHEHTVHEPEAGGPSGQDPGTVSGHRHGAC